MELILLFVFLLFLNIMFMRWFGTMAFNAGFEHASQNPIWMKVLIVRDFEDGGYRFFDMVGDRFLAQSASIDEGCIRVAKEYNKTNQVVVFVPGISVYENVKPV